ncbi:MAG: AAA family ATPase [Patescibacteria group bacterium]
MYLKRLELSGFKSFAKTTVLLFPSRVVAIVGPNGSGKSNITEAIRWALGEQSMKILRGKKGEDLVWNGSPPPSGGVPRMGKASVSLTFENENRSIPVDFSEVTLTRKIFRDGANEYFINDSTVRLKDIVELIARMGLGEQKHNIISQGEVDRLLLVTPMTRREMLEEALGLRVWQLKKNEAERKLEATQRNMEQADAVLRELTPHLKFLRLQVKRAEARESTRRELADMERVYVTREERDIAAEYHALTARRNPLVEKQTAIRADITRLTDEVRHAEKAPTAPDAEYQRRIADGTRRRQELEREIGRLEGKLEAMSNMPHMMPRAVAGHAPASIGNDETLRGLLGRLRALVREQDDIEIIRSRFFLLMEQVELAVDALLKTRHVHAPPASVPATETDTRAEELEQTIRVLGVELEHIIQATGVDEEVLRKANEGMQAQHERLRALERGLRLRQDEEREVVLALDRLKFDEEKIEERSRRLKYIIEGGVREDLPDDAALFSQWQGVTQEELYRRIERNRVKLEEAGGIDAGVVKEYEETEARHTFLTAEREDVARAAVSLGDLIKELDMRIAQDFKDGFGKIKDAFHEYFRIVFGGGTGKLRIITIEPRSPAEDEDGAEEKMEKEEGIEIEVDLPRKRIHSLAMLSGGERALTAIALLFAITAVNPPPFLILDETDAALDEANSQRYAAIMKELAKKTQLIVVTHNRETMKSAGVLYGVTMGDDGVSRLLSLKLEEAEEYTNH